MSPAMATRMGEKSKQSCGCFPGLTKLAPADISRNSKMFEECTVFNKRMQACEKQIKALKVATDGMVAVADKTLSDPLPQVWDKDAATGMPRALPNQDVSLQSGSLKRSTSLNLKQQVLDPINQWRQEYTKTKGRMAQLAKAQLELDAARRAFYSVQKKGVQLNAKHANQPDAPLHQEGDDPTLIAARNKFAQLEAVVHEELIYLVRRTRAVHRYLTRAMQLESQALQDVAEMVESEGATPVQAISAGSPAASPTAGSTAGTPTSGFNTAGNTMTSGPTSGFNTAGATGSPMSGVNTTAPPQAMPAM